MFHFFCQVRVPSRCLALGREQLGGVGALLERGAAADGGPAVPLEHQVLGLHHSFPEPQRPICSQLLLRSVIDGQPSDCGAA